MVTVVLAAGALIGSLYLLTVWIAPTFGLGLLDMLIALADADWPGRLLLG